MKKTIIYQAKNACNRFMLLLSFLLWSCLGFAQEKKVDVTINTKSGNNDNFFMQPWVWIVGGAVFILLLVALLRGSGSKK